MTAHATLLKFGHPDTIVAEYAHWTVLLRNQQITLGSLVLVCNDEATAFPDISAAAFAELKPVTRELERALAATFAFDKINYLMLRMVDPHVHFHVLPRYAATRTFEGETFGDGAWPRPPDLSSVLSMNETTRARLLTVLREAMKRESRR